MFSMPSLPPTAAEYTREALTAVRSQRALVENERTTFIKKLMEFDHDELEVSEENPAIGIPQVLGLVGHNQWVGLMFPADREAMFKLLKAAVGDFPKVTNGWIKLEDQADDEVELFNINFLKTYARGFIEALTVREGGTSWFAQYLACLLPRVKYYDNKKPVEHIDNIVYQYQMLQERKLYVTVEKYTGEKINCKIRGIEPKEKGYSFKFEQFVYNGKNGYNSTTLSAHSNKLKQIKKLTRNTVPKIYQQFQNLTKQYQGFPVVMADGQFKELQSIVKKTPRMSGMMAMMMGGGDEYSFETKTFRQPAVIDPELLYEENEAAWVACMRKYEIDAMSGANKAVLDDYEQRIVSDKVVMYGIRNKKWFVGTLTQTQPLIWDRGLLDKVIMSDTQRDVLRALVMTKPKNLDLVKDKGENTIFLFKGEPGTGKTLTAEAVSHMLGVPLLKVSFGELGTDVSEVEKMFTTILRYSHRWNAALLLDEADVFLEERNSTNLERTALVASFLGMLEYAHGLVFLTTNRTNTIDPAIRSRVAMEFTFKTADLPQEKLWHEVLERVGITEVEEGELSELHAYGFNGREIIHMLDVAVRMAEYRKEALSIEHIKAVGEVYAKR